jgi:hypothetical protein
LITYAFVDQYMIDYILFIGQHTTKFKSSKLLVSTKGLSTWTYEDGPNLLIYFHGNSGCIESTWMNVAEQFLLAFPGTFTFCTYDYRGYGHSYGVTDEKNILSDAILMYDHFVEMFPCDKIILYGRSLGSRVALHVAESKPYSHMVLETPFIGTHQLRHRILKWFPEHLSFNPQKVNHDQITLILGGKDELINSATVQKIFPERCCIELESGHNDVFLSSLWNKTMKYILNSIDIHLKTLKNVHLHSPKLSAVPILHE